MTAHQIKALALGVVVLVYVALIEIASYVLSRRLSTTLRVDQS